MTEHTKSSGTAPTRQAGGGASPVEKETARPSDMPGGDTGASSPPAQANAKYAGEPGPAGLQGENHMDPLREKRGGE